MGGLLGSVDLFRTNRVNEGIWVARILVIDDDEAVNSCTCRILQHDGHEVVSVLCPDEGIPLFRETPFDLVVTDINMPTKDGHQTIRELTSEFPGVQIIAVSGSGGVIGRDGNLKLAEELGARASVAKPFTVAELNSVVRKVLGDRA